MNTDNAAPQHLPSHELLPTSSAANGTIATKRQPATTAEISESHRIYWQQWLSSNEKSVGTRREWVTSSAAVRISGVARASDVTGLLRESLQLSPLAEGGHEQDALVLVGTLYSLSRDYVRFEHEKSGVDPRGQQQQQHKSSSSALHRHTGAKSTSSSTSSDAFNVMRTLQPSEYPLQVRDRMADHLRKLQAEFVLGRTIIAPKLQWYYCPVVQPSDKQNLIPSCVNLEGYCTSMEEEEGEWGYDDDDDDNDESSITAAAAAAGADKDENDSTDGGTVEDIDLLSARFPWLRVHDKDGSDDNASIRQSAEMPSIRHLHRKKQYRRENRRLHVLSAYESSIPQGTLSGYLLKRSTQDMHVWRRVHCVLTDDYLWFVSRRYKKYDLSFAKHGRVRLTRALLLEPSVDYAPLYRTPYAFEMVAADGTSHVFRAANRTVQRQWIKAISDRIIQSYENSLLESAQLIVNDECVARAKRIDTAMDQLWERINEQQSASSSETTAKSSPSVISTRSGPVGKVLRWTLKVTDFRHFCRHVRSTLPAKSPVVVTSPSNTRKPPPPSALLAREMSGEHLRVLDPLVQSMVRSSWQQAAALLQEATEVGQFLLHLTSQPHRNLETLLRHVEFVLTGRQRPVRVSSGNSMASEDTASSYHDRAEPPPMDLFDALEKELQLIAVSMPE